MIFRYKVAGLDKQSDSVHEVLETIARNMNFHLINPSKNKQILEPQDVFWDVYDHALFQDALTSYRMNIDNSLDIERAASYLISLYRDGKFGPMTLDDCSKDGLNAFFENGALTNSVDGTEEHIIRKKR